MGDRLVRADRGAEATPSAGPAFVRNAVLVKRSRAAGTRLRAACAHLSPGERAARALRGWTVGARVTQLQFAAGARVADHAVRAPRRRATADVGAAAVLGAV